ncbi:MAG: hypothetical protein LBL13_11845, partial [Bacteroidales bacterium]|nr:hypothetical protein [Bacteroidales bacterium]
PEKEFCRDESPEIKRKHKLIGNDILYDTDLEQLTISALKEELKERDDIIRKQNREIIDLKTKKDVEAIDSETETDDTKYENMEDNEQKHALRTMKVTTDVLKEILKLAGVKENEVDKTHIANLASYLTGYSRESIRKRLVNLEELTKRHRLEADKANQMLEEINVKISIKYDKYR